MRQLTILAGAALAAALAASPVLASPGITTGNVNMRAEATVHSPRLTTIPADSAVEVHGCPTWCSVTFRGLTGWVSPNYIAMADYAPAPPPVVYYERAPAPYFYYRNPPPYWHGGHYRGRPHHRPWPRRYGSGFSFSFGF